MSGFKPKGPSASQVTVTVKPNGTYYVEKKKPQAQPSPSAPPPASSVSLVLGKPGRPLAAAITTALQDFAGVTAAVRQVAPSIGKYGVIAAIGVSVLDAIGAFDKPAKAPGSKFHLRRVRLVRVRKP